MIRNYAWLISEIVGRIEIILVAMSAMREGSFNWQALYGQLLSQYSGLSTHLHTVNSENAALFQQLELLYHERVALQDESPTQQL
jgi:hypothetical protein